MHKRLVKLYNDLPYPLRSAAATAYGYYLKWWRYNNETATMVEQALERDAWNTERWQAYQQERLAYLLHRAATTVPYYREYWQKRRQAGDDTSWEVLENWPVLRKDVLREHPERFVADGASKDKLFKSHTSGTSGKPLTLWINQTDTRFWYALFDARWLQWYNVSRNDRWAMLNGQLVVPVKQQTPPFWVWNGAMKQLYMSTYHISAKNVPSYIEAMKAHKVKYLYGQSAAMYSLARFAREQGLEPPKISVAISNAEPLYPHQRQLVEEYFGCAVRETYGMAEKVAAASECEAGSLHIWPEAGVIEVMDDAEDRLIPDGQAGRLICTGLINTDMPLIRYEIGDRGRLSTRQVCPCGRSLPMIESIEGRLDDVVLTPDGRRVSRLSPAFKGDLAIREAQIIQESLHKLRVKVVPAKGYSDKDETMIVKSIRDRVGDMEIIVEEVESIPRSANGKFRAVISHVTGAQPPVHS
jgi:phenylacetate-CoA ligase